MVSYERVILHGVIFIVYASTALCFFWGSSEQTSQSPIPPYPLAYYRVIQVPHQPQQPNDEESVPIPAIPLQTPMQASLSPLPNIQNVQLVPCVCPIQSGFEYEKPLENNNVYAPPKYISQ